MSRPWARASAADVVSAGTELIEPEAGVSAGQDRADRSSPSACRWNARSRPRSAASAARCACPICRWARTGWRAMPSTPRKWRSCSASSAASARPSARCSTRFGRNRAVRREAQSGLCQPAVPAHLQPCRRPGWSIPAVRPRAGPDARQRAAARGARLSGMAARAAGLVPCARTARGALAPWRRHALARGGQPMPDGGLLDDLRGSHRAAAAFGHARHAAAHPHGDFRQPVRSSRCSGRTGGCSCGTGALRANWGSRRNSLPSIRAPMPCSAALARQLKRPAQVSTIGQVIQSASLGAQAAERAHPAGRRARVRHRRGAAARWQWPPHRARYHRFRKGRGGAARTQCRAGGGGRGEDALYRQHELRIPHAADLDRRLCRAPAERPGG